MLKSKSLALRGIAAAALISVCLAALPAAAVDTGGGGGGGGGGSSSSSGGGGGGSSSSDEGGPSLADARSLIRQEEWARAVVMLKKIVAADSRNADALNLLGFSLRKSGDTEHALGFYLKALKINPRHKGAHEYLGELYVETGHMDKAKAELETLAKLCGNTTCEEYEDLEKAIGKAG